VCSGALQLSAVSDKGSSSTEACKSKKDWLSFTNTGLADIDLEGFMLTDDRGASHKDAFAFGPSTSIVAGATMLLCEGAAGSFQFGIGSDDTITLWDANGNVVDSTTLKGDGAYDKVWTRTEAGWRYMEGSLYAPTQDGLVDPIFYADTTVPSITVSLQQSGWDSLKSCHQGDYLVDKADRIQACDYHPATCRLAYATHNATMPCRVKRKGEGSWRPLDQKPALKVKLDTEWNGLKELTLNNAVEDKFKVTERIAYRMYQMANVPAPRANTARVLFYVPGSGMDDDYKTYVNIESVSDKQFVKAMFPGKDAVVWGGAKRWSWRKGYYNTGVTEFSYSLNACGAKDPLDTLECGVGCGSGENESSAKSLLGELTAVAGGCTKAEVDESLWEQLDREAFLRAMAMDRLVNHSDSLCGSLLKNSPIHGNNFMLYHDGVKFGVIPWGLDETLKGVDKPMWKRKNFDGCVQLQACFDDTILPGCKKDYVRIFRELIALFEDRTDELYSLIDIAESQVRAISPDVPPPTDIRKYLSELPNMFADLNEECLNDCWPSYIWVYVTISVILALLLVAGVVILRFRVYLATKFFSKNAVIDPLPHHLKHEKITEDTITTQN